ncbi:flavodoxin [Methanothermobacter tenebrarum]|uniref:Flavodoxin n=1 Tax=Methanothermobacter tenebrarum TaxID=680118 RepID=A0A328P9T1_9EURY|nr:flavodoxin domain-containing protein [Methanothermobacter tenebrarum]MBC7100118.1 flavodoxin domain-containing protein [Methanobacteriales archaeon]MBC7117672.1 flavodoxin domain-containing protein [Methanobacteriaceae archaeon]NPV64907.1 flavodoxin [Methanobacteriaceae archaeon]RAO79398.1 flavodoxin [Methanothermobacter tenebrarum]
MKKVLIIYYSKTKKTETVAKTLANELSAETIEIKDLKDRYGLLSNIGSIIDAIRENKTRIEPETIDLSGYDLLYIGSPTWAGKPAPAIITLIDNLNLKGKDVILFATMARQGGSNVIDRMAEKIKARGGRIINSFTIKTGGKQFQDIKEDALKVIAEKDLKIYSIG